MMPSFLVSGASFIKIEITCNFSLGALWRKGCLSSLCVQHLVQWDPLLSWARGVFRIVNKPLLGSFVDGGCCLENSKVREDLICNLGTS